MVDVGVDGQDLLLHRTHSFFIYLCLHTLSVPALAGRGRSAHLPWCLSGTTSWRRRAVPTTTFCRATPPGAFSPPGPLASRRGRACARLPRATHLPPPPGWRWNPDRGTARIRSHRDGGTGLTPQPVSAYRGQGWRSLLTRTRLHSSLCLLSCLYSPSIHMHCWLRGGTCMHGGRGAASCTRAHAPAALGAAGLPRTTRVTHCLARTHNLPACSRAVGGREDYTPTCLPHLQEAWAEAGEQKEDRTRLPGQHADNCSGLDHLTTMRIYQTFITWQATQACRHAQQEAHSRLRGDACVVDTAFAHGTPYPHLPTDERRPSRALPGALPFGSLTRKRACAPHIGAQHTATTPSLPHTRTFSPRPFSL